MNANLIITCAAIALAILAAVFGAGTLRAFAARRVKFNKVVREE